MSCKIGIIDYGAGNLQSVRNALRALDQDPRWVQSAADLDNLDALVLPGQGQFGDCVRSLRERGLWDPIRDWLRDGRPYFGICLGYQILFDSGEESPGTPGLGIFPGTVPRFHDPRLKVPHMGWNALALAHPDDPLWKGLAAQPYAYFVHSYYPAPTDPALIAAATEYGVTFASAIRSGRIVATQFHPEKSQETGLNILRNFLDQVAC